MRVKFTGFVEARSTDPIDILCGIEEQSNDGEVFLSKQRIAQNLSLTGEKTEIPHICTCPYCCQLHPFGERLEVQLENLRKRLDKT